MVIQVLVGTAARQDRDPLTGAETSFRERSKPKPHGRSLKLIDDSNVLVQSQMECNRGCAATFKTQG